MSRSLDHTDRRLPAFRFYVARQSLVRQTDDVWTTSLVRRHSRRGWTTMTTTTTTFCPTNFVHWSSRPTPRQRPNSSPCLSVLRPHTWNLTTLSAEKLSQTVNGFSWQTMKSDICLCKRAELKFGLSTELSENVKWFRCIRPNLDCKTASSIAAPNKKPSCR